jgi:fructose-1,6-bisphosphatase/inositol monophosphatase family enzyme
MELDHCLKILKTIGVSIRDRLLESINIQSTDTKSAIHKYGSDDIIYQIDKDVEDLIFSGFKEHAEKLGGIVLIAEGIDENGGFVVLPEGMDQLDAKFRVIIDPIDGTRGLMYDKRSAFYLAAIAPNKGENTCLLDIEAAVMMELPTSKSYLCDSFSSIKGKGVKGWRTNLLKQQEHVLFATPSNSKTIYGGFAQFSRFFSPGKDVIAAIEEQIIGSLFPDAPDGQAFVFEDQYISSGGQFYEILMGHDRFTADIRGTLFKKFKLDGKKTGLACHPYDICTSLILQEAGVIITNLQGGQLDYKLDTITNVDWVAFANNEIKDEVWPVFQKTLRSFHIIE